MNKNCSKTPNSSFCCFQRSVIHNYNNTKLCFYDSLVTIEVKLYIPITYSKISSLSLKHILEICPLNDSCLLVKHVSEID